MRESIKENDIKDKEIVKSNTNNIILTDYYRTYYPIEKDFSLLDSRSENLELKIKYPNDEIISTEKKSEKSTKIIDSSNEIKTNKNNKGKEEDEKKENEKKEVEKKEDKKNEDEKKLDEKKENENINEGIQLSDIKIEEIKKNKKTMSQIFRARNKTFVEELKRYHFTYSTPVEYKENNSSFKNYILLISQNKLYILQNKKPKNRLNSDESLIKNLLTSKKNLSEKSIKELYDISHPILSLNFDTITSKIFINKKTNILIIQVLNIPPQSFILRFPNNEILIKYTCIINQAILSSEGNEQNLFGISLRFKNYYKMNTISTLEFENIAKTGDIILFQGSECPSNCQRFFTRDEYDHVALVKKSGGFISIYEATSIRKCSPMIWDVFKYDLFPLVYRKVVYRRLIIDESNNYKREQIQKKIEKDIADFIAETTKKEYYLSIPSILCCKSPNDYEKKREWKKSKGYSCSSLLTAAYYTAGILNFDKGVHSRLPGHYSQDKELNFCKGFSLGPEKLIEFSE